jgi:polyhydroxyalkanoate synthesis regulator phasin
MSDEQTSSPGDTGENGEAHEKSRRDAIEDRFKQGLGVLGAMRDAIEDTIREVKERGDVSPDRAREVVRNALDRAQEKAGEARDALDFVKQKEFDGLKEMVEDLASRMGIVEEKLGGVTEEDEEDAP